MVFSMDMNKQRNNTQSSNIDSLKIDEINNIIKQITTEEIENAKKDFWLLDILECVNLDSGADNYQAVFIDKYVEAKALANHSNVGDLPAIGCTRKDYPLKVLGSCTSQDILADNFYDRIRFLISHGMRLNLRLMNQTCLLGDKESNLKGLLNNNEISNNGLSLGVSSKNTFFNELEATYSTLIKNTKGRLRPDTILISMNLYDQISFSSELSESFDRFTRRYNITVKPLFELNDAFDDGTNGYILLKNDYEVLHYAVAPLFEVAPIEYSSSEIRMNFYSKFSGLVISNPEAIAIRYDCLK